MVEPEVGHNTLDCGTHYVIQPVLNFWDESENGYTAFPRCPAGFAYNSGTNDRWVDADAMKRMILDLNLPGAEDLREAWRDVLPSREPAEACAR
jgi:hypothetical protein